MRQRIERPADVTVTMLPNGKVRWGARHFDAVAAAKGSSKAVSVGYLFAAYPAFEIPQILKSICLTSQLARDHRRIACYAGNNGNANAPALKRLNQRAESAIAGKQHNLINVTRQLHRIDRELDVHIAFDLAATAGVSEFLGHLSDDRVTVVIEPIEKRPDRGELVVLDDRRVEKGANQRASALEFDQQTLEVDFKAERLACRMQIGTVDKKRDLSVPIGQPYCSDG
jgi:hypothetical protein